MLAKCAAGHPTVILAHRMTEACGLGVFKVAGLSITPLKLRKGALADLVNGLYLDSSDNLLSVSEALYGASENTIWISSVMRLLMYQFKGLGICMLEPRRSVYTNTGAGKRVFCF
jgi:hypothetical protein